MKKTSKKHRTWIRLTACLLALALCFVSAVNSSAAASVSCKVSGIYRRYSGAAYKVYVNGRRVNNFTRPGVMVNDNVMIPYKKTLIASRILGMTSSYSQKYKRVTLNYKGITAKFYVGKKFMYVNGTKKKINTAPFYAKEYGTTLIMLPAKALAIHAFGLDYEYDREHKAVSLTADKDVDPNNNTLPINGDSNLQASAFKTMTTTQFINALGPIARENYRQTGILASVTLAQAILESGWGKTTLAQNGNNIFGMKISLSGNSWKGSTWDGKSYCTIRTVEEYGGRKVTITAKFRKYSNVAQSIADHSAYLLNAKNGSSYRYAGIANATTYSKQIDIIRDGGYCTWSSYKSQLVSIINRYNLTKYDIK